MEFFELFILAINALRTNIVRTILTMLGVIIGIASVIIIMSLGNGATQSIVGEISSFGANILTIQAGRNTRGPGGGGGSTVDTLIEDDVEALALLPNVNSAAGLISTNKQITYDGNVFQTSITGVEETYMNIHELNLSQGSFISSSQVATRSKVVVLGDGLVEDIFGEDAQVVGESIRIDGKSFRIIGVITDSSSALAPISTVQKVILSQNYYNSIEVLVSDSDSVTQVEEAVTNTLLLRHEIKNSNDADFSIRSAQEMIDSISSVTGTLSAMLSGIAAISLVVGGIGIMNIMLVTVTERTREIGLLKAIGAKQKDILWQFLIEAVVVTLMGGLIGLLLGIIITFIATKFLSIPFVVSIASILLAIGVSTAVGIVFGYYPAKKAAKLQPIDALRYE
ncbi:MAG: ABC-type antimicrobial peptide transport system, permease component [Candidatus Pacebacteria bacterium GW2011_GWF2_38_9]|nr:MAG: antimicrobial peptide ABC transporter permease, putative ABC transport system permease protein [candidate division TM6 bacterium GW2011_GWF2_28_16]KKQ10342.1 MAG: ABC-type antimicrobial peptide transport system, permease component [Candidatus Pacebacteria bacterium GW2011_GWF1_36_5]KKQ88706.1 MAG: ABC-type antimicrobial peptide transport system, permease component [Candidatus Pacebacteria bacterium GW2011_GWF2_38_9]HAZ73649.1 multidrug ABC transporter substrate-binding protein [Candidatu